MTTTLYRHFDGDGTLLYIGVTGNPARRMLAHRRQPWWPAVERTEQEQYDTRAQALDAEFVAITTEHPLHNIVADQRGTPGRKGVNLELPDDLHETVKQLAKDRGQTLKGFVIVELRRAVARIEREAEDEEQ